jgi:serine/threonine protein kinase
MEILQKNEAFKRIDGNMKFSYVQVFAQQDGILYSGKWANRLDTPKRLDDLQELKQISTEDRGPEVNITWSAVYVKTPSLLAYANGNLEKQISREVETCEILRKNPHPNIAIYYGYMETRGRVSGLCFKRYTSTLLETVNPQHLNKVAFVSNSRELVKEHMKHGLQGILAAIKHLHSLGIVHNDINPANIMLDEDGTLILNDFDSCRYIGESLRNTGAKRTHQWHDPSVDVSLEKNDLDAFEELNVWLKGSVTEEFLFEVLVSKRQHREIIFTLCLGPSCGSMMKYPTGVPSVRK